MKQLANKWAGRIFGTNTGNVFLALDQEGNSIKGRLRIMDSIFGVSVYQCEGSVDNERLMMDCTPEYAPEGVELGNVTISGSLNRDGNIRGDWESTIGTAGTFELFPHSSNDSQFAVESKPGNPEQIHNKTLQVGSLRLFKEDVVQLINFMKKDFTAGRVIVTYAQRSSELTKYADDFLEKIDDIGTLNYLKLVIQEPEAYGINRVIVIEFVQSGASEIRVSGINESWVLGKAESLYQILRPKQNSLVTTYRKYGLNLNAVIFIAMLIVIPDIEKWQDRTLFVVVVFVLLSFLLFVHNKLIPNTAIYLEQSRPGVFKRAWPSILSWLIAASSSIVAAYLYSLLTGPSS
ncbi:hypothetical protein [Marinobacter gudaonensis]|nr:hypothetical protein [Marinobacter gudaonensis]